MQIKNTADRYGAIAQLFHWVIVALIVTQFVLASRAEAAEEARQLLQLDRILATHRSVGMTIFMLAILRLIWRFSNPVPAPAPTTKPWQARLAGIVHWALYALILLTPLAGWLMSSAKSGSVAWFGWFTFPDLIAPDEARFEQLEELHELLATSIFALAILHILAALKHHFIDKDNVLRRMLPLKLR